MILWLWHSVRRDDEYIINKLSHLKVVGKTKRVRLKKQIGQKDDKRSKEIRTKRERG